jgi:hypothetical protein
VAPRLGGERKRLEVGNDLDRWGLPVSSREREKGADRAGAGQGELGQAVGFGPSTKERERGEERESWAGPTGESVRER